MPEGNYPAQYESRVLLNDGRNVFVRPIKPEDEDLMLDLFNQLSDRSKYLRFLKQIETLPKDLLYKYAHVDYDRDFALVTVIQENGKDAIIGIARYIYDPERSLAEFAAVIRDDYQNKGLGKSLLQKIFNIGKEHGILHFVCTIEPRNRTLRHMLLGLGYTVNHISKNGAYQVEILI